MSNLFEEELRRINSTLNNLVRKGAGINSTAGQTIIGQNVRIEGNLDVTGTLPAVPEHSADLITSGTLDGSRLPGISTTKRSGVPAAPTPTGKFLKDDGTWDNVSISNSLFTTPGGSIYSIINRSWVDILLNQPYCTGIWSGAQQKVNSSVNTFADLSGSGHALEKTGTAAHELTNVGIAKEYCLKFIRSNLGFISYTNSGDLQANGGNWLHFGGWFRFDDSNQYSGLMGWGASNPCLGMYRDTSNKVVLYLYNTAGTLKTWTPSFIVSSGWHFIVARVGWGNTSSQDVKICVDGVWQTNPTNIGAAPRTNTERFSIGYYKDYYLQGAISRNFVCGWADQQAISDLYEITKVYYT